MGVSTAPGQTATARTPMAAPSRFVTSVKTRELGLAVVRLGGGRTRPEQGIDHAVGLTEVAGIGAKAEAGTPLAIVHARTEGQAGEAAVAVRAAYGLGESKPAEHPVVYERLGPES